jgi:hypothetical protein
MVLHHSATESGSLASFDRDHRERNSWDECGYHFVIGNGTESGDGEIEVGSRWIKQKHGAHCKPPGHPEYNEQGIGICLAGNLDHYPPTSKQVEACRRLIRYLAEAYGIPHSRISTHGELHPEHTACPGRYFPLDAVLGDSTLAYR